MKDPAFFFVDEKTINGFFGEFTWLSNFWECKIEFKDVSFLSVEAAYQASKCENFEEFLSFKTLTPIEARKRGKKIKLRADWDKVKYNIMFYLVFQKFSRNPALALNLRETLNKKLIGANNWGDTYWGIAYKEYDGLWVTSGGFNRLGMVLHDVREILK